MRPALAGLLVAALTTAASAAAQEAPSRPPADAPYRDARRAPSERAQDLLARMTLDEKFWQLFMIPGDRDDASHDYRHGSFGLQINAPAGMRAEALRSDTLNAGVVARAHTERINALQRWFVSDTRLGIPLLPFEETLHGLGREGATTFPQAIGLAATWDTALVSRVAGAIASEARSRGIRLSLSPVVNIANDVRWGRVEETYGEDTWLTSAMARAYISALETRGVIATPKHFVANVGDGGRDSYPIEFSERLLRERYYPPFLTAIRDAHAGSVMSSYNSVDGSPSTQNRALLTDVLRGEWRFSGFVMSDAAATGGSTVLHHTEASTATATRHALESGLDVIFQSSYEQHRPYLAAFRTSGLSMAVIDSAVARVLRAKFAMGLFESPYGSADSAAALARSPAHRALARESAVASFVLLRNERARLPLALGTKRIALIGSDATEARVGGYSPPGARAVSIVDGIRAAVPAGTVLRVSEGVPRIWKPLVVIPAAHFTTVRDGATVPGLRGEYWPNISFDGTPAITRTDAQIDFGWTLNSPGRGIPYDWYSARWTGTLTVPAGGARTIAIEGNDGYRLFVNDTLRIDRWRKASYGTQSARVSMAGGSRHRVRLEYFEATGNARLKFVWDAGVRDPQPAAIARAVADARASDVAIVVAGIEEGEFRDRALLGLPGRQEELIRAVAATGTPVVVVLVGGSAITMPWLDRVDAVLDVWYPGQDGGHAVADVMFGKASPGGKLPLTFPMHEGQVPLHYAHKPTGRGDDYLDLTGQARFPFGHGLSYTTFVYRDLAVDVRPKSDSVALLVSLTVENSGARRGDEVVQLYLRDVLASVARPMMELAGFTRIALAPGASQRVTFSVRRDQLSLLDANMRRVEEPGAWRIMVGASSKDIRLRREVDVP
ncbi:glycoside hydrolase family 3 N-terminal domain-containing protein [Gemmatimonas groenlandica]|uniref:Beta-glucosidase n=1 Tax=Gemmatimonas groenlandica TaxID=2732249 RepID=A0A6M4IH24_9BACT|nr:glycoside hydrolase family 3 N-terminal domain-containing protein [Gemmatimonas groenlandica]QJR34404.1 beta-glucosidase [Gemmatimonas groenlandica]